jgi:hypothetical protein
LDESDIGSPRRMMRDYSTPTACGKVGA